jgi:site-specific DNA recombinase
MTAVVYARQLNAAGDTFSVEAQITQCKDYALQIGCRELEVFVDEGITGWTLDRPGLQGALARLQAGDVGYFIFSDLECLAKRLRDQMLLIKTIEELGVRVVSVRTPIPYPVSLICLPQEYVSSCKIN